MGLGGAAMRRFILLFFVSFELLVSCMQINADFFAQRYAAGSKDYFAYIEEAGTRVHLDDEMNACWTEGDEISIFATTFNQRFRFVGKTGDANGTFSEVSGSFFSGTALEAVYAVYPYSDDTAIEPNGVVSLTLPAVQHYAENSYGLGGNTMVAVTESPADRNLCFKNLCGYIVVKLYGEGKVRRITLSGNNDEKIAGAALVTASFGNPPTVSMSASAATSVTLDCGEGVVVGKTPEDATAFWIAVPPVTFSHGFTLRIERDDEWAMTKTTFTRREIIRKTMNPTSPLMVDFTIPSNGVIKFADGNFKAYCVGRFDVDLDNEVSYDEAKGVTVIECPDASIGSVEELKYFTALEELDISGNPISGLNLSGNRRLVDLDAGGTDVTEMDLRYNSHLQTANFHNCVKLRSILVRGFGENDLPAMIVKDDITFKAVDNSSKAIPAFGHFLLTLPVGGSVYALALTDLAGIGLKSPIDGMEIPDLAEARSIQKWQGLYLRLLGDAGLDLLEGVRFLTKTPTGTTYRHEYTYKSGANRWTTVYETRTYYYCFTLNGGITEDGVTCSRGPSCCSDLEMHKTGLYIF